MQEVHLGIDLGTSSVKAVLLDCEGVQLAVAQQVYAIVRSSPLWAEQDPFKWWSATTSAITEVLSRGPFRVLSVGVAGQMHGLVLLGDDGTPVRPAIVWSDCRADSQIEKWHDLIDPQRVEQISGFPVALGMLGVSLTWVRDNEPEVYARGRIAMLPKDYVRYRLTGRFNLEPTDAGGSLLFDVREGVLSSEIIKALALPRELFPTVIPSLSIAGEVSLEASEATGLAVGIPVAAGGSDQAMAALALGLENPSRAAVALSSGGTVFKRTGAPIDHSLGLHVMPDATPGKWLAMGVTLSAGLGVNWLAESLLSDKATPQRITALMAAAELVSAGSDGLLFSPNLAGVRTPVVDASMRGSIIGLGINHDIAHMTRAMVEGVCITLSRSLTAMSDAREPVRELVISGGLARFALWRQTLSDVTGLPVSVSGEVEHSAIGAAHAGSIAVSRPIKLNASARTIETLYPIASNHEVYARVAENLTAVEHALANRKGAQSLHS